MTIEHSLWQVSRVKQGMLTLPEHLAWFHIPCKKLLTVFVVHWLDIYNLLIDL